MREVLLDGRKMQDKESMHHYLQTQLAIPSYYGSNLDALWDALSSYDKEMNIVLVNKEALLSSLESYGIATIKLFEDIALEYPHISFTTK